MNWKEYFKTYGLECEVCHHKHTGEHGSCQFLAKGCDCTLLFINSSIPNKFVRWVPLIIIGLVIYVVAVFVWYNLK